MVLVERGESVGNKWNEGRKSWIYGYLEGHVGWKEPFFLNQVRGFKFSHYRALIFHLQPTAGPICKLQETTQSGLKWFC